MDRHLAPDGMVKERHGIAVGKLLEPSRPEAESRRHEDHGSAKPLPSHLERDESAERAADDDLGVDLVGCAEGDAHHLVEVELLEGGHVQVARVELVSGRQDLAQSLNLAAKRRRSEAVEVEKGGCQSLEMAVAD